jgi:hypothetical protein
MQLTTLTMATMASLATASLLPRADYGAWNVTLTHTGGADRGRSSRITFP